MFVNSSALVTSSNDSELSPQNSWYVRDLEPCWFGIGDLRVHENEIFRKWTGFDIAQEDH
jgi:hypothetical protein